MCFFSLFLFFFPNWDFLRSYREWNRGSAPLSSAFSSEKGSEKKNRIERVKCSLLTLPSLSIFQAVVHIGHTFNKSRKDSDH